MPENPLENFENKSKLLSDDEQELIRVLASFYEAIEDLRTQIALLFTLVGAKKLDG